MKGRGTRGNEGMKRKPFEESTAKGRTDVCI